MKIANTEIFMLNGGRPGWRPIVVRVNTDEGLYGYGEASLGFDTAAEGAVGMLNEMSHLIIGMDPMDHEVIWNRMFSDSFWAQGGGAVLFSAISAIDTALWDIRGKALKVPVWRLLGGKINPSLRSYASQIQFGWSDKGMVFDRGGRTEDLKENALKAVEDGYDAVKVNIITYEEDGSRLGFLRGPLSLARQHLIEKRIKAIREAVGEDVDILIENHARTDLVSAVQMAHILEPYHIFFMEEPSTPMFSENCGKLAAASPVPVAGGERVYGRWHYQELFQQHALAVVQPDIGTCGGITETKKVCDMAFPYDIAVQTHVCGSPIAIAASLHMEAVLPHFCIHEHHVTNLSYENRSLGLYDYQPVNGYQTVPDLPGLGQELSEKAIKEAHIHLIVEG